MNQNHDLSQLIRECRSETHLSQYRLAEFLGVSQNTVYRWETGSSAPNARNLAKLITVFQHVLRREVSALAVLKQIQAVQPKQYDTEVEMPLKEVMFEKLVKLKDELHKVNTAC